MSTNDPKATFGATESESNESGIATQKPLDDSSNHSQTEPGFSAEAEPSSERMVRELPNEIGGRKGPEPTRYGDWEKNGRCIDF